jgi:hypothetical protein
MGEALAPGGAAGRREGGPQPKGWQPQRWLGPPAGRQGPGKILTCRSLDGFPSPWRPVAAPPSHNSSALSHLGVRCAVRHSQSSNILGGFVISARSANDEDESIVTSAHRVEGV